MEAVVFQLDHGLGRLCPLHFIRHKGDDLLLPPCRPGIFPVTLVFGGEPDRRNRVTPAKLKAELVGVLPEPPFGVSDATGRSF